MIFFPHRRTIKLCILLLPVATCLCWLLSMTVLTRNEVSDETGPNEVHDVPPRDKRSPFRLERKHVRISYARLLRNTPADAEYSRLDEASLPPDAHHVSSRHFSPMRRDGDIVFFNPVMKTGSSTIGNLFRRLSGVTDKFKYEVDLNVYRAHWRMGPLTKPSQEYFVEHVLKERQLPLFYKMQVHMINFEEFNRTNPLYVTSVRDPVRRFHSRFYYLRWSSGRDYEGVKAFEPNLVGNASRLDWAKEELEECIVSGHRGCNPLPGDIVDHQLSYLCGQAPECTRYGSRPAATLALANLDRHYALATVQEMFTDSLLALQELLPEVFGKGLCDLYTGQVGRKGGWKSRQSLSAEATAKLRDVLALEYEVYDVAVQRFKGQIDAIKRKIEAAK